ncbi:hypothetical protein GGI13_005421 [Coemansia sp. RSA 455]|nr:hypothetical protein GGI13_005421 [Coemansia sp. RSA 455]
MSVNLLAFTEEIQDLYVNGTFYESYVAKLKTKDELNMIKAKARACSPTILREHLQDGTTSNKGRVLSLHERTSVQAEYVEDEIKFYKLLAANAADGVMPSGVDMVWVNDDVKDCEMAKEFKRNAAVLEKDYIRAHFPNARNAPITLLGMLDPFLYLFSTERSLLLEKPAISPEEALNFESPRTKPGSVADWNNAINEYNKSLTSDDGTQFDTREIASLVQALDMPNAGEYLCWLPTDFYVNEDGSVTIRSYINNLHPVLYADLYKSISKVFAKFVPLLEQVATDVLHPPKPRAAFDKEDWYVSDMLRPDVIIEMVKQDKPIPEEYQQFVTTSSAYCYGGQGNTTLKVKDTELDMTALNRAWKATMARIRPAILPFGTPERLIEPYSVRGLTLQASVDVVSIFLTPKKARLSEQRWQAVGGAGERVFAIGLYFYDVENISRAPIKFREPVSGKVFNDSYEMQKFCSAFKVNGDATRESEYSQEVGEIEITNGQYICYPNLYQTKMPYLQLADLTKPGHAKFIAFLIADPTTKLISTAVVPPQQPSWAKPTEIDENVLACEEAEELKLAYENHGKYVDQRFNVRLSLRDD